MEPIKLNLNVTAVNRWPVTIQDSEEVPTDPNYELREMTAAQRDSYIDLTQNRFERDKDGKPVHEKRIEGIQAELLFRCLRKLPNDVVTKETIQKWPAASVQQLFDAAKKLNRLDEKDETKVADDAKKESAASE